MAKATMYATIAGLSGSIDKDHYARQTKDGQTIICLKPDFSNRQFSEAQLGAQGGMKVATEYAKVASRENPIYAELAEGTVKNAYNVAVGDWFNPPVIHRIECDNGNIRVHVYDDVKVTRVTVSILDESGHFLEQGEAEQKQLIWWVYDAMNRGAVQVDAWDLPGNRTSQTFCPPSQSYCYWVKTYQPKRKRRR
jgi:hypothetical protein